MKEKSNRNTNDLEWLRDQIMTFACGAHAFGVELDEFDPEKEWNAIFVVKFHGTDREERLFCRAVKGDQHVRFWVEATFEEATWKDHVDEVSLSVSRFDVALGTIEIVDHGKVRLARLSTRAWIPHFSQRIFGLTFSNLMDCKAGVSRLFKGPPLGS